MEAGTEANLRSMSPLRVAQAIAALPPVQSCKAWVKFDATRDSTGAASTANTARWIYASDGVTSVVRTAAGKFTLNFSAALADANYSATGSTGKNASADAHTRAVFETIDFSASALQFGYVNHNTGVTYDNPANSVAVFR